MAFLKYLCNTTHPGADNKFYVKGRTYLFESDPGSRFDLTSNEVYRQHTSGCLDLDNTFYAGENVFGWDDWKFPFTRTRQGALNKPDFDYTNIGLLFPNGDASEIVYATEITSHKFRSGAGLSWHPHIHYIQDEAEIPTFKLDYRQYNLGEAVPSFTTIATTGETIFTYVSGAIHQILVFPSIPAATSLAAIFDWKLYRDDTDVTGDVLAKEFDIHVQFDAPLGSGQEFLK
jgi:hypothetical protein